VQDRDGWLTDLPSGTNGIGGWVSPRGRMDNTEILPPPGCTAY